MSFSLSRFVQFFFSIFSIPKRKKNKKLNPPDLSSSSCNRHQQLKHNYYCKFLPKTQSLDIADASAIANIHSHEKCFESINEELQQPDGAAAAAKPMMPKLTSLDNNCQSRPIFPSLNYSPYGSPRISRKPARESRRVSIDKNGSFLQLNQYKLMDQIGVVSSFVVNSIFVLFLLVILIILKFLSSSNFSGQLWACETCLQ
jgi:hypothetical protein